MPSVHPLKMKPSERSSKKTIFAKEIVVFDRIKIKSYDKFPSVVNKNYYSFFYHYTFLKITYNIFLWKRVGASVQGGGVGFLGLLWGSLFFLLHIQDDVRWF